MTCLLASKTLDSITFITKHITENGSLFIDFFASTSFIVLILRLYFIYCLQTINLYRYPVSFINRILATDCLVDEAALRIGWSNSMYYKSNFHLYS